jgi:hypothetical protein
MRWLKHLSMAHADREVDLIIETAGPVAYGIYWLIVEDIAASMEPGKMEPYAIHSLSKWCALFRLHHRTVTPLLTLLGRKLLNVVPMDDGRIKIEVPNIMKYKDEYTKKSGPRGRGRAEGDRDRDREQSGGGGEASEVAEPEPANENPPPPPPPVPLPISTPKSQPDWQVDESYAPLVAAWRQHKHDAIDEDFARNYKHWTGLDAAQKQRAIGCLRERVEAGLQTSTTLGYWLREDYKRAVDVNGYRNGTRAPVQRKEGVAESVRNLVKKRIAEGRSPL